jgi:hypothetical protein
MATRKSLGEAQKLVAELQIRHPNAIFRIVDNSKTMRVGRGAAEMQGFKVVEDDGGIMVMAEVAAFDVYEVRQCRCGAEVLTAAIGENNLDECQICRKKREERQAKVSRHNQFHAARRVAQAEWRDRWEER